MNTLHHAWRHGVTCAAFRLAASILIALAPIVSIAQTTANAQSGDPLTTPDASGWLRTFTTDGTIDRANAFFQSLGTNGRSCGSCHRQEDAWTVTPEHVRARFDASGGTDPIFRTNDGSNSPSADVSTVAKRRQAYSMLLRRGVIRVGIGIPAGAQFSLVAVADPYGYASASELSLFRRPLPSTNLAFVTGVMWDGRETAVPFLPPMDAGTDNADLVASLKHQAIDATLGHAQGAMPSDAQLAQIIALEMGLSTAQIRDNRAGFLNEDDALGGPRILANLRFHVGINDTLGADPTGAAFDPESMSLFSAWDDAGNHGYNSGHDRESIARGERLFNSKPISISGVGGLNDALGVTVIPGTCTTCHNAPNIGNHTVSLPLNIGLTDAVRRTPDMPLYTLRNNATGETVQTTDPGKALLSGKWSDIGKFKGPVLRGLAARAPYFHNGFAASLDEVVDFYNTRFNIGFTAREKSDLVAFMRAL
jgi:cytochrome c peroxidase